MFRPVSYGYDPTTGLGFKTATFEITGAKLIRGIEGTLSYLGLSDEFFLQFSGFSYPYDLRKDIGQRVILRSVRVNGKPLNLARKYTVTVNEAIAILLPLLGVQVTNLQILPDLDYNVVKDYIDRLGIVPYLSYGRVRDVSVRRW